MFGLGLRARSSSSPRAGVCRDTIFASLILLGFSILVNAATIEVVACVVNPYAEYNRLNASDLIVTNASRTNGDVRPLVVPFLLFQKQSYQLAVPQSKNYLAHWEAARVWERLVQNRTTTLGDNFNVSYLFLSGDPWEWNTQLQNFITLRNATLPRFWLLPAANYFAGVLGETLSPYPVLSMAPFVFSRANLRCPSAAAGACEPGARRASNLFATRFPIDDVLRMVEEWACSSGAKTFAYLGTPADDFSAIFLRGLVERGVNRVPQARLVFNLTQPSNISWDAVVADLAALDPDFIYYMWSADSYQLFRRAQQLNWYPKGVFMGSAGTPSVSVPRIGWVLSGDTQYLVRTQIELLHKISLLILNGRQNRSLWNDPLYYPTVSITNTSLSQYSTAPIRLLRSNKTMFGVGYHVVAQLSILHQAINRVGTNLSRILAEYQNTSAPFQTILGPVFFDSLGVVDPFRSTGRYVSQYTTQTSVAPVYPPSLAETFPRWPIPGPCKPPAPLGFDFCNNITRRWYSNTLVVGNSTVQSGLSVPVEVQGNLTFTPGSTISIVGNAGEIFVTGCVVIEGGVLQVEMEPAQIRTDGSFSAVVLTSSSGCLTGSFRNVTAIVSSSNGTCYRTTAESIYSSSTLSVTVNVVQAACPFSDGSQGGLLVWQLGLSIGAPILASVAIVGGILALPPIRRKIFPGRDFFVALEKKSGAVKT